VPPMPVTTFVLCSWKPRFLRFLTSSSSSASASDHGSGKSFYEMIKSNPEMFAAYKANGFNYTKEQFLWLRSMPELYRLYRDGMNVHGRKHIAKPEIRSKYRVAATAYYDTHKEDEIFQKGRRMYRLCFNISTKNKPWIREQLPWKSYQPVLYPVAVQHHCKGCGVTRSPIKSWWKSLNSEDYLCNRCYTTSADWSGIMPKGYEDIETIKGLVQRRKELSASTTKY